MGYLTISQTYDHTDNDESHFDETQNDKVRIYETRIYETPKNRKDKSCYYSDVDGCYIVDAITGAKYPWKVGSIDETRFFRVIDTVDNNNNKTKNGNINSNYSYSSRKAYYENPHVYMRHKQVELDEELVRAWYNRYDTLYPDS